MEYVLVRCRCGRIEHVPVHPADEARADGTMLCGPCLVAGPRPRSSWRGLLGLAAATIGVIVGLSEWLLVGKQPRTGR